MEALREEVDRLESAYQRERAGAAEAVRQAQGKYEECLEQLRRAVGAGRARAELEEEVGALRGEREEAVRRVEQYRRLVQLLQAESQENTVSLSLFGEMKRQLLELRERAHFEHLQLAATDKQNKEILTANQ